MEIKRTTEILVETYRQFVIHQGATTAVCPECGEPMLTAEQTAALLGISQRAIFQSIEAGGIHFLESETRALLVCLRSFTRNFTTVIAP